ncbi:MAG: 3-phosphoglycerate dehydrogenase [Oscillospiraceae bacterium]|jgi:phosphoglycerate dehydrogenase-like enzyme|nr:3-phosphoglycerate dehydrogenase [Oscillospiraceae bacterium]
MSKKIALYGAFSANMLQALNSQCPAGFETYPVATGDLAALAAADYMVNRGGAVDARTLDAAPRVKWIQKWGVGYDKIDIKVAGERGIPVGICVGGNSLPVAELTVTLMLNVLRNAIPLNEKMKAGEWSREQYAARSYLLHGKTVGLVGIGNIARKVATIVRNGFEVQVLYYDLFRLSAEQEKTLGVTYVELDTLMAQSDIISIHVPLLQSTKGMVNKEKLALMKPTACIINTSRGGVINEPDLIEALRANRILGAGLDTFAQEPLPKNSELLKLDCVVATPHCGGNTVDNDINMAAICMDCIARYDASGNCEMREIVNSEFLINPITESRKLNDQYRQ